MSWKKLTKEKKKLAYYCFVSVMSVLRFLFSPSDPNLDRQPGLDEDVRKALCLRSNLVLLSGPLSTGKTSLVWAFCQSVCCSLEHTTYIICDRKRLERGQATPLLTEGSSTVSLVWKRVSIKLDQLLSFVWVSDLFVSFFLR